MSCSTSSLIGLDNLEGKGANELVLKLELIGLDVTLAWLELVEGVGMVGFVAWEVPLLFGWLGSE